MTKPQTTADCLYVCGDSWTCGSELIDPTSDIPNHFDPVHEKYRMAHHWPRLVADRMGVELIDGSMAGASNDRMLRVTMYDVANLIMQGRRPFVIVAWSQLQRFELPEGPKGEFWRSFVSPRNPGEPRVAIDTWKQWSSDRSDVVKWIQQLISLSLFLKANGVDHLGLTVFKETYWLYEQYTSQEADFFKPYLTQIRQHVNFTRHALNISMETYLGQHENVAYGPGGHPLRHGHVLMADQIYSQLTSKFHFQRLQAL